MLRRFRGERSLLHAFWKFFAGSLVWLCFALRLVPDGSAECKQMMPALIESAGGCQVLQCSFQRSVLKTWKTLKMMPGGVE